jgi:hypothetical protein
MIRYAQKYFETIYLNYLKMIDPMFAFTNKQRTEQNAEKCSDESRAGGGVV